MNLFITVAAFGKFWISNGNVQFFFTERLNVSQVLIHVGNESQVLRKAAHLSETHLFRCNSVCSAMIRHLQVIVTVDAVDYIMCNTQGELEGRFYLSRNTTRVELPETNVTPIRLNGKYPARAMVTYLNSDYDVLEAQSASLDLEKGLLIITFNETIYEEAAYGFSDAKLTVYFENGFSMATILSYEFENNKELITGIEIQIGTECIKVHATSLGGISLVQAHDIDENWSLRLTMRFRSRTKKDFIFGEFPYELLFNGGTFQCSMMETSDMCYETLNYYFQRDAPWMLDGNPELDVAILLAIYDTKKVLKYSQVFRNVPFWEAIIFDVLGILTQKYLKLSLYSELRPNLCKLDEEQPTIFDIYSYENEEQLYHGPTANSHVISFTAPFFQSTEIVEHKIGGVEKFKRLEERLQHQMLIELFIKRGTTLCTSVSITTIDVEYETKEFQNILISLNCVIAVMIFAVLAFKLLGRRSANLNPQEI